MRKTIAISSLLLFFNTLMLPAQIDSVLVSHANFKNSKYDNSHAGSGFLLRYKGNIYGCTAKHVLFFAKTDSMKTISFDNELESWSFQSKLNPNKKVFASNLINEDKNEKLTMPPKGDWLIFKLQNKIQDGIMIYPLREKPLKVGEDVYFLGYTYNSERPIKVHGKYIGLTTNKNLKLDVPKGIYNGCSGGPVLDSEGKVIGIVSMGYYNEKEKRMIFEPASTNYFKEVIDNL